MTDSKQAWEEVGSKFSGLGQRLRQHLDAERRAQEEAGEPTAEQTGEQANKDIRAAIEKMTTALDDAFDALGKAAKDPAVREDVSDAGRSLVGALGTSLEQLGDEVRRLVDRKKSRGGAEPTDAGSDDRTAGETVTGGEISGGGTAASEPPITGSINDTPEDGTAGV